MSSAVMLNSFFSKPAFQLNLTIGPFKLSPAARVAFHSGQSCLPVGGAVPDDGESTVWCRKWVEVIWGAIGSEDLPLISHRVKQDQKRRGRLEPEAKTFS